VWRKCWNEITKKTAEVSRMRGTESVMGQFEFNALVDGEPHTHRFIDLAA